MPDRYAVSVGAGSLRLDDGIAMEHRWTGAGVTIAAGFTGAHLLNLAVAGCVLNDLYREAERLGHKLGGVRVNARGAFDADGRPTPIEYTVALDSALGAEELEELLAAVESVAEVPQVLAAGIPVRRMDHG